MRAVFSVVGLLAALLVVALLIKKQLLPTMQAIPATPTVSTESAATITTQTSPAGISPIPPTTTPQQKVQQFKQHLDAAMEQTTRNVPDDK